MIIIHWINQIKSFLVVGLFVLNALSSFGQNDTVFIRSSIDGYEEKLTYKTDTIVFDSPMAKQLLYGTTVLPSTENQMNARNFGIYLSSASISQCQQDREQSKVNADQIISVVERGDSLVVEVKIWGNCCHSFLCDLQVVDDQTINLLTIGYGHSYCFCDCCFGLTFHISKEEVDDYKKLKSIMINNNEKSLGVISDHH